jgi:hypothetical protein
VYRLSDKAWLGVAIFAVVGLFFFAKHLSSPANGTPLMGTAGTTMSTSPVPPSTSTSKAAASKRAVRRYLATLKRIDAPAAAKERGERPLLHRELPKPGIPITLPAQRAIAAIRTAYHRASVRVTRLPAPTGFADASTFLARTYADQSSFYAATLKLATGTKTAAQDPYGTLNKLKKIETAVQRFDIDLTACRRAFKEATASANLANPHWIARLINGATGRTGQLSHYPSTSQIP